MRPTIHQMMNLPKWAREHIEHLERQLEHEHLRATAGWEKEPTDFCIERYNPVTNDVIYLPLENYDDVRVQGIRVNRRNGQCQATTWTGVIQVLPHSSNLITIERKDP